MIDNSDLVRQFMPGGSKGPISNKDHFLYTELLDRTKRVGNNGVRIVKTFFHRSVEDFDNHLPQMRQLCDALGVRAYTRLSPRSFERVGKLCLVDMTQAAVSGNWAGMKTIYQSACGRVTPERKLWLWDVDVISEHSIKFCFWLHDRKLLLETIPSKRGLHYVTDTFDLRRWDAVQDPTSLEMTGVPGMTLQKNSPTNLYIPDTAV
jgi:hypothetical protein